MYNAKHIGGKTTNYSKTGLNHKIGYSGISIIRTLDFSKLAILRTLKLFPLDLLRSDFHLRFLEPNSVSSGGSENRYSTVL